MLEIKWTAKDGWEKPKISPFHDLVLHPAAKCLHYATEVRKLSATSFFFCVLCRGILLLIHESFYFQLFEGVKAYRGVDNKIRLFRIDKNMERMRQTAERACLPVSKKSLFFIIA